MSSPFLWRHVGLLLLAAVNLAVSLVVLVRAPGPDSPLWLGAVLRGASVLWAAVSLLAFGVAAILFFVVEVSPDARACWARRAAWETIRPGMKREEVLQLLGEPFRAGDTLVPEAKEQLEYGLHALGPLDEGAVFLDGNGVVVSKLPPGSAATEWLPDRATRELREMVFVGNLGLLALLTLATFVPVGAASFRSWTLYTPLVALLLGVVYELTRSPGGWRFDLFFTVPAYLVVGAGGLLRLLFLVRRS